MASVYDRWPKVEERYLEIGVALTAEQVAKIEKYNPCFKERHVESSRPGELLSQDTMFVGNIKGVGKVYLHACIDTYGPMLSAFFIPAKSLNALLSWLVHNDIIPFYHPFELYLALNDVEHRRTKVKSPQPTALLSASIKLFWMNFSVLLFGKTSMRASKHSKMTWING